MVQSLSRVVENSRETTLANCPRCAGCQAPRRPVSQAHRAVQQYTGPLLPGSFAPGVVDLRLHVEECLRRAVMAASDPDLLIQFATAQGDDLELWESARASLAHGDYRLPLVIARIRRIREAWR